MVLCDLDGTLRGDVRPMVRLAEPLLPRVSGKLARREPLRLRKRAHFTWTLGRLWSLRSLHSHERRRYKRLFSELHHLAASMLRGVALADMEQHYAACADRMSDLWFERSGELLNGLREFARPCIVTGSEQLQTLACLRALDLDPELAPVLTFGSLYGVTTAEGEAAYSGDVDRLNVTLDGKRDVVQHLAGARVLGAIGNSRPDRALFEAVVPGGLRALICTESVLRHQRANFVVRKLERSGFQVVWNVDDYLACSESATSPPVLALGSGFEGLLEDERLLLRLREMAGDGG